MEAAAAASAGLPHIAPLLQTMVSAAMMMASAATTLATARALATADSRA